LRKGFGLIAGLDIGASTTKGVILKNREIVHGCLVPTSEPASTASKTLESLLANTGAKEGIDLVAVSGGGARKIGDVLLGLPVIKVDEIHAIGSGGLTLARKRKGLVVSVGTGTAMVAAYAGGKRVRHVGGTGVGGGTLLGLSRRLLGIEDFQTLENMASRGNTNMVDLTVGDIVGGSVGIVPAEATASNFGRLADVACEKDVAAGIFNMVSQVIGVLAAMAAKAYGLEDSVILAGRLVASYIVFEDIRKSAGLFGVKAYVPRHCEYCTAVGAARHVFLSGKLSR